MEILNSKLMNQLFEVIQKRPGIATPLTAMAVKQVTATRLGNTTLVLGNAQVREVMRRETDFSLAQLNRDRVITGDFLLTRDDTQRYQAEKKSVLAAFGHGTGGSSDLIEAVRVHARERSKAILDVVHTDQPFDVARNLAEPIAAEVIDRFVIGRLGEPYPEPEEPLVDSLCNLARFLVSDLSRDKTLRPLAQLSRTQLMQRLQDRYTQCEAQPSPASEACILSRMVASARPEAIGVKAWKQSIIANVAGASLAGCLTVSTSIARALDQLLTRPDVLDAAIRAAEQGHKGQVLRYVLEVLRFNPMFPVLRRHCVSQTSLDISVGNRLQLNAGDTILLGMQAAMLDPRALATPDRIRLDRSLREYLLFGDGLHECIGNQLAMVQLEEIFSALLPLRPRAYSITPRYQTGIEYGNTWPAARRFKIWLDGQQ